MSAVTHTPGPWVADMGYIVTEDRRLPALSADPGDDLYQVYIAEICREDEEGLFIDDHDEQQANAQLLAASPDLLEALSDAIDMLLYLKPEKFDDDEHQANWQATLDKARAAYDKSGGL